MIKNRIFYYDFLRAFAIIAVVMCHVDYFFGVWNDATWKFVVHSIFHGMELIGVPIFLMLTGALLLNRNYALSYFLKRRFTRIIYPFIFWLTIIMLLGVFYYNWDNSQLWNIFIGNGSIMWYIWMLIGIYLFIPIINSFFKEYKFKGFEYFLSIWFLTIFLKTIQLWPVFPSYPLNTNFELNYFADFIGYPILGYYLANKNFNINNNKMLIIGILIFLASLFSYVYCDFNKINIGPIYQNVINVLMAIGLFLSIEYASKLNLFGVIKETILEKIIISIM